MHMKFRNVNDAFRGLVGLFDEASRDEEDQSASEVEVLKVLTRNGPVLQIMEPAIITYERPTERVLFNQARDCNPFFHLYESLWMLAGRNDIAPLDYYLGGRYSQFSDDKITANGAYGYRWRHAKADIVGDENEPQPSRGDQLQVIINHLRERPQDRRCVLQMWNVEDDLLKMKTSKDVCCNLCCCFLLRSEPKEVCERCGGNGIEIYDGEDVCARCRGTKINPVKGEFGWRQPRDFLDMTVFNRSNDLANGMLGANVVHFSVLQEYMAAQIGVDVGTYNQVSNNLHVYTESFGGFPAEKWLADETPNAYEDVGPVLSDPPSWKTPGVVPFPLVRDPATFDRELSDFVGAFNGEEEPWDCVPKYEEPFFQAVAGPLLTAFRCHKQRSYGDALNWIEQVQADDWKIAGRNWIEKRRKNWEAKNA